ncbi:MAG TPA: DNA polymerase/3'-5' exonuclease PolX, partial [Gemmatales bacterium]|nr:DNA polymerase/3'-5' exonuclease PolX [Gemmatales bacterium]
METAQVAALIDEIGTLLALKGENSFRCNAYHRAARALEQFSGDLATEVAKKTLDQIPGIGSGIAEKITTLVQTGHMPYYEELKAALPAGLLEMMRLPGLGPKKVKLLYDQLQIDSLDKLKAACTSGQVAELSGFGAKSAAKILEGLAFLDQVGKRFLLSDASAQGEELLQAAREWPGVIRAELCGSLRRRRETVADLDLLVSAADAEPIMAAFVAWPGARQVLAHGPTKSSIILAGGMQADLRVVQDAQFPFALHYFTGSKEHNIAIRARAQQRGFKLNEYGLEGMKWKKPCRNEADLFAALGLDDIPPELREATGEIEAAEAHELPDLVTDADIQGIFHCHSTWSDGSASIADMARAAKRLGYKYYGIGDHSESLKVANGLDPARVRQQHAEIDRIQAELKGIQLLKGTECDILPDGSLDYADDVLAQFDYVVASVHTHMSQTRAEMTDRLVRAVSHPRVTMLGHMSGRLLLRRDSYPLDHEAVFR